MGWNVPTLLALKYPQYEIYVITRSRCKEKILNELEEHTIENLHFLFYDIPRGCFTKTK